MRLMIDTNIVLDVLTREGELHDTSAAVLRKCEDRTVQGFVTASTITDIFYLTRRALHSTEETYKVVGHILNLVKVLTVTNDDVPTAFQARAHDFEDCLLATCAKSNKCDGIVTRNKKDFLTFGITLYSPEEFLDLFAEE